MAHRRPIVLTPEQLAQLVTDFDPWARARIDAEGRFMVMEAIDMIAAHHLVGSPTGSTQTHGRILKAVLAALPHYGSLGLKSGYTLLGSLTGPHTLATLVANSAAVAKANPDYTPPPGRRTDRRTTRINPSQQVKIEGAAATFAEMVTTLLGLQPDRRALDRVGPGYFLWDPKASNGTGDWAACAAIADYSDRTAEAAHVAAGNDPALWQPHLNADRRKKNVQGMRLLLDLAAAHGWISPADEPAPLPTLHAPEWTPVIKDWVGGLVADPRQTAKNEVGSRRIADVRILALYATRKGWLAPAQVRWEEVRRDIEQTVKQGADRGLLDNARKVYNHLIALGKIQGPHWPTIQDTKIVLVKHELIARAARTLDVSGLRMADGQYPAGLCEGLFGLKAYLQWLTLPQNELALAGLPPRGWPHPTPQQQLEMAKSPRLFQLKPTTLLGRMQALMYHAGYLARHEGVDFTKAGLDVLCDPALFDKHVAFRDGKDGHDSHMSRLVQDLGMVASPFLEARALQARDAARTNGNLAETEAYEAKAQQLAAWAIQLKLKQAGLNPRKQSGKAWEQDQDEYTREKAVAIWQAFSIDGRSGWHKLALLRDELVLEIEREGWICTGGKAGLGRVSVQRQLELIRQDAALMTAHRASARATYEGSSAGAQPRAFRATLKWATAVKNAVLLTLVHRIPLRPTNVINLTMDEWRNHSHSANPQPWEGGIELQISPAKMKAPRGFTPAYLLAEDRADEHVMASARVDLLALYFTAAGARDELLRLPNGFAGVHPDTNEPLEFALGEVVPSQYVFPTAARQTNNRGRTQAERLLGGLRWCQGSYEDMFRKLLKKYAGMLRIDLETLRRTHGGLGPHLVRHLFGSHHCDPDRWPDAIGVSQASKMLHHKDTETTENFYCGMTAREISIGRIRPGATPPQVQIADYAAELEAVVRRFEAGTITEAEFLAAKASLAARYRVGGEVTAAA